MHRILVEEKNWISEEPVSACAELLHAAAGAGGAAARDLYRLAAAPDRRRHHGRRAVHPARHHRHHGLELHLRGLRQCRLRRGAVLRPEGGGARDRDPGRGPRRQARAAQPDHDRARGDRLRRDLLFRRAVPDHHHRGRRDRLSRRQKRPAANSPRSSMAAAARSCRGRQHARRRTARPCPPQRAARAARQRDLAVAVAGAGRGAPDRRSARPMCSARSRCSSPRWRW